MALHWRANNGPTLNAFLVALRYSRRSGPVLLRNPIALWFSRGVHTPCPPPPLDPRMEKGIAYWNYYNVEIVEERHLIHGGTHVVREHDCITWCTVDVTHIVSLPCIIVASTRVWSIAGPLWKGIKMNFIIRKHMIPPLRITPLFYFKVICARGIHLGRSLHLHSYSVYALPT